MQFLLLSWLERLIPLFCVYDAASTSHRIYLIIPNLILTVRFWSSGQGDGKWSGQSFKKLFSDGKLNFLTTAFALLRSSKHSIVPQPLN